MKNIRFIKEPGYTYDLFFLFTLYFNKEHCMKTFTNYNKSAEDAKFYERLLADFGTVSKDLLIFFHLGNKQHNWITKYYFRPYKEKFLQGTYSLDTVQEALLNYDQVIENVLEHYFENESAETIRKCKGSLVETNKLLRESEYEGYVQSALYAFLIDPVPIIQRLSYELMAKEFVLAKQYDQKFQELSALQEKINLDFLSKELKTCGYDSINIDAFDKVFVSFCCNNKNLINMFTFKSKEPVMLLLGMDYIDLLKYLKEMKTVPKLHEFGLVLSEENRIAILQLVREKGEMTIKELEQELEMAGTNAYYHIAMMTKTGMLNTRNKGRTILYRLNPEYFEAIVDVIKLLAPKEGNVAHEELENTDDNNCH